MVTLAFLVPVALLVRSVARDRALSGAQRDAQALAPVLALTSDPAALGAAVSATASGRDGRLSLFLADGRRVGGTAAVNQESLQLARAGSAFFAGARGGGGRGGGRGGGGGALSLLPAVSAGGASGAHG